MRIYTQEEFAEMLKEEEAELNKKLELRLHKYDRRKKRFNELLAKVPRKKRFTRLAEIKEYEEAGQFEIADNKRRDYEELKEWHRRERYKKEEGTYQGYEMFKEQKENAKKDYANNWMKKNKDKRKLYDQNKRDRIRCLHYISINGIKLQKNLPIKILELIYNNLKQAYLHEKVEVEVYNYD